MTPRLPYTWWYWAGAGALYGVLVRALFGVLNEPFAGPMSAAFLLATPFAAGAVTIYGVRDTRPSWLALIFMPWATIALMLLGCAVTLMEGSICIALMAPLFLVLGSLGGVSMGLALKFSGHRHPPLAAAFLLPILVAAGEDQVPQHERQLEVRHSIYVNAAPPTVWNEILAARAIRPDELPISLAHLIGVPRPLEGVNVHTPQGEVRYSKWERGVAFRGVVTQRREHESIGWRYAFDAHSFPSGSMDEHVAIGGRYFDLRDTVFNLYGTPGGHTRLEIVAHYRVTSSINAYAVPASKLLGHDFVATILGLYKHRSERRSGEF